MKANAPINLSENDHFTTEFHGLAKDLFECNNVVLTNQQHNSKELIEYVGFRMMNVTHSSEEILEKGVRVGELLPLIWIPWHTRI